MAILIDGHNLIGAGVFPDIRLEDEDDEAKLVARLKVWKSRYKGKMTVVFDRGIPGGIDHRLGGAGVEVIFAADPRQADDLIRRRLHRHARDLILVTNDDTLRREAESHRIPAWSGAEFAQRLSAPAAPVAGAADAAAEKAAAEKAAAEDAGAQAHVKLTDAEVTEWLALFGPPRKRPERRPRPHGQAKPPSDKKQLPTKRQRPGKR